MLNSCGLSYRYWYITSSMARDWTVGVWATRQRGNFIDTRVHMPKFAAYQRFVAMVKIATVARSVHPMCRSEIVQISHDVSKMFFRPRDASLQHKNGLVALVTFALGRFRIRTIAFFCRFGRPASAREPGMVASGTSMGCLVTCLSNI
jgi:hypothetical protein